MNTVIIDPHDIEMNICTRCTHSLLRHHFKIMYIRSLISQALHLLFLLTLCLPTLQQHLPQIPSLNIELCIPGHLRPSLIDAHHLKLWPLPQRNHPCQPIAGIRLRRQGHLQTVWDDLGHALVPACPLQLLTEAHGVEDHFDVPQLVGGREGRAEHAGLDTFSEGAAPHSLLGTEDEGAHEDIIRQNHVVFVDVIVGVDVTTGVVGVDVVGDGVLGGGGPAGRGGGVFVVDGDDAFPAPTLMVGIAIFVFLLIVVMMFVIAIAAMAVRNRRNNRRRSHQACGR